MGVVIAITIIAKPGAEESLAETLRSLAADSQQEDGCIAYEPSRAQGDPSTFFLYEHWRDADALESHRHAPHFAAGSAGLAAASVSRTRVDLTPL